MDFLVSIVEVVTQDKMEKDTSVIIFSIVIICFLLFLFLLFSDYTPNKEYDEIDWINDNNLVTYEMKYLIDNYNYTCYTEMIPSIKKKQFNFCCENGIDNVYQYLDNYYEPYFIINQTRCKLYEKED